MNSNGSKGILTRYCTSEFKIKPIIAKCRELAGLKPRQKLNRTAVVQWIGISLDEVVRMKDSRTPWIEHRWPLIEKKMSRHDCLRWLKKNHFDTPPRSACVYCPYHSNDEWRKIKAVESEWLEAIRIDELIRTGIRGTKDQLFIHSSCRPLRSVDLSTEEERGQLNMFNNECEGMCGV